MLAPEGHAGAPRGDQLLAAEIEAGAHHVEARPAGLDAGEIARHVRHGAADGAITLSAASGADGVSLAIDDEGPGLPDGDAFGTFSRIAGSDRTGGAGLGLAIVRGFGEAMGVTVRAENRASGAGARFSLRFPPERVLGGTFMP